jgi:hypothetical protein
VPRWLVWLGAVLAAVPVLVTVTLSVPAHEQLAGGFDAAAHARLVGTNWLRTLAWTAHGAVATVHAGPDGRSGAERPVSSGQRDRPALGGADALDDPVRPRGGTASSRLTAP